MKWEEYKSQLQVNHPDVYQVEKDDEAIVRVIKQITDIRNERGWTQRLLAEKSGIKQSVIARIESFRANPTLNTLIRLLNVLGAEIILKTDDIDEQKVQISCAYNSGFIKGLSCGSQQRNLRGDQFGKQSGRDRTVAIQC